MLLLTDGVLEAASPDGVEFGRIGWSRCFARMRADAGTWSTSCWARCGRTRAGNGWSTTM